MSGPPSEPGLSESGLAEGASPRGKGVTPAKPTKKRSLTRELLLLQQQAAVQAELRQQLIDGPRNNFYRSLPGLYASLAAHFLVIIILAFTVIRYESRPPGDDPVDLFLGQEGTTLEPGSASSVEVEVMSLADEMRAAARNTKPPTAVATTNENAAPTVKPVDVSGALTGRGVGGGTGSGDGNGTGSGSRGRGDPNGVDGGKKKPEWEALDKALAWIVRQQQPDGHWMMTGPYPDGATSLEADTHTGATALSLLALLGDGNTPTNGVYQKQVKKGIQWLIDHQKPNGDLFDSQEQGRSAHFYAHAQATIALCEALALSGDESIRPAAKKAIQFLVAAQNPTLGGWKYRPLDAEGIGDLSVTGWALMALHTGRMAKIEVPTETFLLASGFLDSTQINPLETSRYRYRPDEPAQDAQLWSMSAEGLLCRQWLGWPRENEAFAKGQIFLTSEVSAPVWEKDQRNVYAWYYTAQTLHNLGGDPWKKWFARTQELIIKNQRGGSWDPNHPRGAFLEWSEGAGRLYFTVMCVLILETPMRHQPVYPEP